MLVEIYNEFGKIIEKYFPEIKVYSLYLGQVEDTQNIKNYPGLYLELIEQSLEPLGKGVDQLFYVARFHMYAYVGQDFDWKNSKKDSSLRFLEMIDKLNTVIVGNRDELAKQGIQAIKRLAGREILPIADTVKKSISDFQFEVFDTCLLEEPLPKYPVKEIDIERI